MPYLATNGSCMDSSKICFDQAGNTKRSADFNKIRKWSVQDILEITEFFVQPDTKLTEQEQQAIIDKNTSNMLTHLQTGPIVCGISLPDDLSTWTGAKVYQNPVKAYYAHDVSVVGYDKTAATPYWIVRNSWGEPWGYGGFFNVEMGKGVLGIELLCRTFTPIEKTDPNTVKNPVMKKAWTDSIKISNERLQKSRLLKNSDKAESQQRMTSLELIIKYMKETSFLSSHSRPYKRSTMASWEDPSVKDLLFKKGSKPYKMISNYEDLPKSCTYDDYKGQNILTWVVNQHLPVYCGSCYA